MVAVEQAVENAEAVVEGFVKVGNVVEEADEIAAAKLASVWKVWLEKMMGWSYIKNLIALNSAVQKEILKGVRVAVFAL